MKPIDICLSISLGWLNQAGWLCFAINKLFFNNEGDHYLKRSFNFHFFIKKSSWVWGYKAGTEESYPMIGLGPFLLLSWIPKEEVNYALPS